MLVFGYVYVYFAIPETKGLSLEEVGTLDHSIVERDLTEPNGIGRRNVPCRRQTLAIIRLEAKPETPVPHRAPKGGS